MNLRRLIKGIGKNESLRGFLCWLISLYIRFARATGTWEERGRDIPQKYWDEGKPFILAFWHGRLLMMPTVWTPSKTKIHMLMSAHRDGQLIARTVAHFGIGYVAGSSTRGGSAALRAMSKALKGGEYVGITPDGPKGPRMRAQDGVIGIAKLSGVPIIPVSYSAKRRWLINSWDRFVVPKPFTGGLFVWGEPVEVPKTADADELEALRHRIEDALNALTDQADHAMDHRSVAPAPPPVRSH